MPFGASIAGDARFAQRVEGPRILLKRDDCTGMAMGGNKTRHNEFLMGEALRQNADVIVWGAHGAIAAGSAVPAVVSLSSGSLATAFGHDLAGQTAAAQTVPWPVNLGGVTIRVVDSANNSRPAGLLFVSPNQINFQIPEGTALGYAAVILDTGRIVLTTISSVRVAAPALFSINDQGVAAATAVRSSVNLQFPVKVFECPGDAASCRLTPIDVGVDTPVTLSLFATGVRNRSSLANVVVNFGNISVTPTYAGPQNQYPGLDQINVGVPLTLRGMGAINVNVTVDGVGSNAVRLSFQ
jgi:uncharacterized protein (TIGR03437 family)